MNLIPKHELVTGRLVLTPLRRNDAAEMMTVLSDEELYAFTGGCPPTIEQLEAQYQAQVAGPSNGPEEWHNWIIRLIDPRVAVGFVQATVVGDSADVAWVVGVNWQRRGIAIDSAIAMCGWLAEQGVTRITAHIKPGHLASERVAYAVGLQPTSEVDAEGEVVWAGGDG